MHEALAVIPFFVGECINLQFLNSNCSYLLSIRIFLVLIALIFFRGILVFGNSYCYEDLFEASNFYKADVFFSKQQLESPIL